MSALAEKQADGTYVIRCAICLRIIVATAEPPERYASLISEHEREACPATIAPGLWAFDNPVTRRLTEDRIEFIMPLIRELRKAVGIDSAVDVGCGLGDFSGFLREFGIPRVVGIDGRSENLTEAQKRHKGVIFQLADAEELPVERLGSFDMVLCFGLLYHLENPLRVIRKLHALTGKVLVIESMCVPGDKPKLELLDESEVQNQGLNYIGFYPSEPGLVKMLTRAGFPFVYEFLKLPENPLYAETTERKRLRTMVIASQVELFLSNLRLARDRPRMSTEYADPWAKPSRRIRSRLRHAYRALTARLKRPLPLRARIGPVHGESPMSRTNVLVAKCARRLGYQIRRLQTARRVWIDVGAHQGQCTFQRAQHDSSILVFAFEPDWSLARELMGKLDNFVVLPMAVADFDGLADFHINVGDETSSLLPFNAQALQSEEWRGIPRLAVRCVVKVPTIRLDSFLNRMAIDAVEYLKIDTQGYDLKVVQSAGERLKDVERVTLEVDTTPLRCYAGSAGKDEIISYMIGQGFKLIAAAPQTDGKEENLTFVRDLH